MLLAMGSFTAPPAFADAPITVVQNPDFGDQFVVPGSANVRIGSYSFAAAEDTGGVRVITVMITTGWRASTYYQNLKLVVGGVRFGDTIAVVADGTTYAFTGDLFTIPAGSTIEVDVYADILSTAAGNMTPATSLRDCMGTTEFFTVVRCGDGQGLAVEE